MRSKPVWRVIGAAAGFFWVGAANADAPSPPPKRETRVIVVSSSLGTEPDRLARTARDVVNRALVEAPPDNVRVVTRDEIKAVADRYARGRQGDPGGVPWAAAEAALKAYDNADLTETRTLLTAILPRLIESAYVARGDARLVTLRRRAALCLALVHLANRDTVAAESVIRQLIQIDPRFEPRASEYPSRFISQFARIRSDVLSALMRVNVEPVSAATGYLVNGVPVAAHAGAQQILLPAGVAWFQWRLGETHGPLVRLEGKSDQSLTIRPDPAREKRIVTIDGQLHLVFHLRGDEETGEKEIATELATAAHADAVIVVRSDGTLIWVTPERTATGKIEFPPRTDQAAKEISRIVAPPISTATRMEATPMRKTRFRAWKWLAASAGLATTAVGLTFGLLAQSSQREYDATPRNLSTIATLRELEATGETRSQIATGAFIAGGVLMAGAALLFAFDKPVAVAIDTRRTRQLPISSFAVGLRWSLR